MRKRIIAALLCLCLLLTLLPTTALAAGGGAIQLGAGGIAKGNTVYYGNYAQSDATGAKKDPIKWRVLSTTPNGTKTTDEAWSAGDGLLLLSDQNLDVQLYHVDDESVTWRRSTLRSWLNGYAAEENKGGDDGVDYTSNNFIHTAFDEKESAQILQTKLENAKNPTYDTAGGVATTDRVFALSIAEVNSLDYFADNAARFGANTAYVASKEEMSSEGDGDIWWLRSPGDNKNRAAAVDDDGSVIDSGYTVPSSVVAVRPAFNLGLDAVLFTSAAVGGKAASGMDSGLTAVSTTTPTEWKLTLKDDNRSFAVTDIAFTGTNAFITYSGATIGANEYISAIVKDSSGNVTYYGRLKHAIAAANASGTVSIDLSGVGDMTGKTLYVFSEQYNGGTNDDSKLTDYASDLVEISLTVTPPAHTHSWADAWTTNSTHHWHECEAAGCTITENSGKDKYGAHVYDDDADMFCNDCNYDRTPPIGTGGIAKGDKVYFGTYSNSPVLWRVLDTKTNKGETGLFLLSDVLLGTGEYGGVYFDNTRSPNTNAWQGSAAQTWCNTFETTNLSENELAAIIKTSKDDGTFTSSTDSVPFAAVTGVLNNDQVFFLSAEEAEKRDYGFSDDSSRIANYGVSAGVWWLRSPFAYSASTAGIVRSGGAVNYYAVDCSWAARPAFNLDLNSVLFTSAAVGGKSVTGMDSGLTAVSTTTPTEWKLTLLDADRIFSAATTAVSGDTLTLSYSGAEIGANEYISAIVKDSSGNVTYYGRMKHTTAAADASGTVNIDLSGVAMAATDTLYVFSEQYNGGASDNTKLTDYASALVEVSQTKNAYTVTDSLRNITSNGLPFAIVSANYTATLTADTDYRLPAAITVKVGGTELTAGTGYTYDSTSGALAIYAASIIGDIEITAAGVADSYAITAAPTSLAFGSVYTGYAQPAKQTVTITNTGNQSITLTQPTATNYDVGALTATTLAAGDTATFTVAPVAGLGIETYNDTITVSGSNGTSASVDVTFAVTHTHAWATAWTSNTTYHWHECTAAGCTITDDSLKDGYGAHTAGDWVIDTNATASTSGSKHKACTACGYVMETATIPATGGGGSYDPTDYYALTFDTNGGSSISTARVSEYATVDLTLSKYIPTREGYEFTGWYSDKALTVKITSIRLTKNTTIYAGWEDKTNPNTGIDNPFTDVKDTDWFFDDVMFVYGNKLMVGTSATTFSPNDTTTRAMVVTILWRMEGSPKVTGSSGFTDVSDGKYYTDAVTWAKQNDIIKGYSNTLFGPNDPVTREQLAAFFYRYAQYKGYDTTISGSISSFKDKDKVSDWAVDAMKWAVGYGVIQGKTGNLLDPQGDATRAQLAAMLHRLIEKNELVAGVTPTGLMGWINPKGLDIPKTGDNTNAAFFSGMFMLSAMALVALLYLRKRKNSDNAPTPTAA